MKTNKEYFMNLPISVVNSNRLIMTVKVIKLNKGWYRAICTPKSIILFFKDVTVMNIYIHDFGSEGTIK